MAYKPPSEPPSKASTPSDRAGIPTVASGLGRLITLLEEGNRNDRFNAAAMVEPAVTATVMLPAGVLFAASCLPTAPVTRRVQRGPRRTRLRIFVKNLWSAVGAELGFVM